LDPFRRENRLRREKDKENTGISFASPSRESHQRNNGARTITFDQVEGKGIYNALGGESPLKGRGGKIWHREKEEKEERT